MNFLKIFGTYFDALQDFLKVHKNTGENMFAKYLSADDCFITTINHDNNNDAICFLITGH